MSHSTFFTGKLYARMSDDLQLGGMSERTHVAYLRAVRKLAEYCQTPPDKISEDQLRRFFLYLKNEKQFAYGSLRVAFSGIKFFYTRTCRRDWRTLATMKLQNVKSLRVGCMRRTGASVLARPGRETPLQNAGRIASPPVGRNAPQCVPRDDPTYSSNLGVQVTSESKSESRPAPSSAHGRGLPDSSSGLACWSRSRRLGAAEAAPALKCWAIFNCPSGAHTRCVRELRGDQPEPLSRRDFR